MTRIETGKLRLKNSGGGGWTLRREDTVSHGIEEKLSIPTLRNTVS